MKSHFTTIHQGHSLRRNILLLLFAGMSLSAHAQHGLVGFANYADLGLQGTTGGGQGTVVHVNTREQLQQYAKGTTPYVIIIDNDLEGKGINDTKDYISLGSNKTIVGAGGGVHLRGLGFDANGQKNIILRNLTITKGKPDGMAFRNTHHVWIDHCDLSDCDDGLLDFTIGSSYMTVSWTRFHNHDKVSVCNSGTQHFEDYGKERVTFHHCRFYDTTQRNPRVGYGLGHVFNNYYNNNSSYCVGYHTRAQVIVENCLFENTKTPLQQMYSNDSMTASYADVLSRGNVFTNVSGNTKDTGKGFDTNLYYDYKFALDETDCLNQQTEQCGPMEGLVYDAIPFPGDGAIGVTAGTVLLCGAMEGVTNQEIRIGTHPDALTESYDKDTVLLPNTTYYWQATTTTDDMEYKSDVFRFTTAPKMAYHPMPTSGEQQAALREATTEKGPCQPLTLRWDKAFDATAYHVYLSSTEEVGEEDYLGETTDNQWLSSGLKHGVSYRWRVDAVADNGEITQGEVWHFTSDISYADLGRTEMEHMVLEGRTFREVENGIYFKASNDTVSTGEAGPGCMTAVWHGEEGEYDITTTYYDENDGRSIYRLYVNEECKDQWTASADNEKLMAHTTETVLLKPEDELRIEFCTENKMMGRTDCLDIQPAAHPSGIEEITEHNTKDCRIYHLDGRYAGKTTTRLPKGIYIMNGKKIVVK